MKLHALLTSSGSDIVTKFQLVGAVVSVGPAEVWTHDLSRYSPMLHLLN